ncbi:hypothetical protein [Catenulispora subtropica]|uniref:hypothetical protein n=1 Tax=Catenulispora subtropica TaxID=450798 RepID=UPI0031D0D60A
MGADGPPVGPAELDDGVADDVSAVADPVAGTAVADVPEPPAGRAGRPHPAAVTPTAAAPASRRSVLL